MSARKVTPEQICTVMQEHLTYSDAARVLGVHHSTVQRYAQVLGVKSACNNSKKGLTELQYKSALEQSSGCFKGASRVLGIAESGVREWAKRRGIQARFSAYGGNSVATLRPSIGGVPPEFRTLAWTKAVKQLEIPDGHVIIGSDMHYWPNKPRSTAHSAMVRLIRQFEPIAVIANGDVVDLPKIGRHPAINWEQRPGVVEEIVIAQQRLREFGQIAKGAALFWTAGNHDLRFESYIANNAPQFAGVAGVHLHDHFPDWEPAWMVEINNAVMVKHRWKGGTHAAYNNTVQSGRSIVTGHLHSAQVTCWTDYNGTRYGVDTGTLAVPYEEAFIDYTEANPVNWRSAVTVLTFYNGKLLLPEQLHVFDETQRLTMFRGQVVQESE